MRDSPDEIARRLQAALDMYEDGISLVRARLVRQNPAASPAEIEDLLRRWQLDRPCDAMGRPRPQAGSVV